MNIRKTYILLFLVFTTSCTTIKQLKNQEIQSFNESTKIIKDNNLFLINTLIDDYNTLLLFDTGATMSVIFDSIAIKKFEGKEFGNLGSVTGADGKSDGIKTFTASFENELFKSKNKAFVYLKKNSNKCNKPNNYKGVVGLDVFFKNDLQLFLNFSENSIININEAQKSKIINEGFQKIKSKCKSKKIFIYLFINNIEYEFKFDTGFSGSFSIPFDSKLDFKDFSSLDYEGSLFSTATSTTIGDESFYEKVPVKIGNIKLNSTVLISKSLKNQNVGLKFINGFDWIIDYNNNNVYIRKNSFDIKEKNNENAFEYLTKINYTNNELVISAKQKEIKKFNLGDQITSVNNTKVTPENICEMQDLLNKTQDWNTLSLEVITTR